MPRRCQSRRSRSPESGTVRSSTCRRAITAFSEHSCANNDPQASTREPRIDDSNKANVDPSTANTAV